MTKREKLEFTIKEKKNIIEKLKKEILELRRDTLLLSDDKQWYTEEEEIFIISKRPKVTKKCLVGRIHYYQDFIDEDNPNNIVTLERTEIVREDGEWV
jgi:hypothetical protein